MALSTIIKVKRKYYNNILTMYPGICKIPIQHGRHSYISISRFPIIELFIKIST